MSASSPASRDLKLANRRPLLVNLLPPTLFLSNPAAPPAGSGVADHPHAASCCSRTEDTLPSSDGSVRQ